MTDGIVQKVFGKEIQRQLRLDKESNSDTYNQCELYCKEVLQKLQIDLIAEIKNISVVDYKTEARDDGTIDTPIGRKVNLVNLIGDTKK